MKQKLCEYCNQFPATFLKNWSKNEIDNICIKCEYHYYRNNALPVGVLDEQPPK